MPYVSTFNRNQMMMCSWDSFVDPESINRLIDAFVNSLDLTKYEVKEVAKEGRPAYDPKGMYKLYIYGNRKGIRSSRKLAESCKVNLEVKDTLEKPCKEWLKAEGKECENAKRAVKGHFEKVKVVKFFLKPSFEKMSQRMCLSENPFGTIKRSMGATYFLLKGLRKVTGEFALFCLGYNMERAKNLLGFEKMMQLMATA